jgi:hypothetical protein
LLRFVILFLKRYHRTILEYMRMAPMLVLAVLLLAFAVEVGWLARC